MTSPTPTSPGPASLRPGQRPTPERMDAILRTHESTGRMLHHLDSQIPYIPPDRKTLRRFIELHEATSDLLTEVEALTTEMGIAEGALDALPDAETADLLTADSRDFWRLLHLLRQHRDALPAPVAAHLAGLDEAIADAGRRPGFEGEGPTLWEDSTLIPTAR